MPDLDLIKQGEQGRRDTDGRFFCGARVIRAGGQRAAATMLTLQLGAGLPARARRSPVSRRTWPFAWSPAMRRCTSP